MLARHDWVTPVLTDILAGEAAALLLGAMLAYKAAGEATTWPARLPSAILSSLLVIFIFVWTRRFAAERSSTPR